MKNKEAKPDSLASLLEWDILIINEQQVWVIILSAWLEQVTWCKTKSGKAPNVAAVEATAIIVESDLNENISNLVNVSSSGSWEAFPILAKILQLGESFQDCRWSWVLRSVNMVVHRLTSRSNSEMCGITWVNHPTSSLVHVLNKDGLPYLP